MSSEQRPGSRLPDDAEYWDDLAARSIDAALGPSRSRVAAERAWWCGLSDAAYVLAASALLAVIGGSLLLGERPRAEADAHALADALGPVDPLLGSLLAASVEPPASALLTLVALREEAR